MALWWHLSFYADNAEVWPESDQVKLLRAHKERMRRWLNKAAATSVRLEILPENPEEIPVFFVCFCVSYGIDSRFPGNHGQSKVAAGHR